MSGETQCEIVYSAASIFWFLTVFNQSYATVPQREEAVRGIRYLLDVDRDRTVQFILQAGLLPQLDDFLTTYGYQAPNLIFKTIERCVSRATVEAGKIPLLIQMLQHEHLEVRQHAACLISTIAETSIEYRDRLLTSGALEPLLLNMRLPEYERLLLNATGAVTNLCHGKPAPAFELVEPAIPVLCEILKVNSVSTDAKFLAAGALFYVSVGESRERERIAIMRTGVLPVLVSFLDDKSSPLLLPALYCLDNLVTDSNECIQKVMDADGFLNHLVRLLESECEARCKEVCLLILFNICANCVDTEAQIGKILSNKELIRSLVTHAFNSDLEIRKLAIMAISIIFLKGNAIQVMLLIHAIGLRPLVDFLGVNIALHANIADQIVINAMEAIDYALFVYAITYVDHSLLDERALEKIQSLQEHPNDYINYKARRILQTYFGAAAEVNDSMAPTMTNSCSF